ncbi:glycerol uptake protein [Trypanosoma rangeli]|uniref:Glycerol uptake protein n=1 Tax=Trypanosoma rangeli TaxID=5698 RepID=A0A3R7MWN2_TRYRA|nr:glycerol uptake protein [Trypanosoma rangeli]RNF09176.1 glycerol uptake protein [Trypanosoma rangeli]|eukprot:RNF09176.1 glycerol uptake protein [Trypanosoma rangeli]
MNGNTAKQMLLRVEPQLALPTVLHVKKGMSATDSKESSNGDSSSHLKARCSVEYILYSVFMVGTVSYGFGVLSEASRLYAKQLNVQPPRWKWLSRPPFNSVGYNNRGDGQWAVLDRWLWLLLPFYACFVIGSCVVRQAFL